MSILQETGFRGANIKVHRRFLPEGIGTSSINQKPSEEGDFQPWKVPLTISGPSLVGGALTLYRMGRDTPSASAYWLSWSAIVHVCRAFDAVDTSERIAFTGTGTPKWTSNTIGLGSAPYPAATRELSVPEPVVLPSVTLTTDGPSGDPRQLYYVYTRVNDIGWESAPSPPFLAPAAKPNAILALSYSEAVPAGNYGINRVRWYRQQVVAGTATAEYFFLREYAIGASGQQDDARALGDKLATENWLPLDTGASWLTYCWNAFAAALVGKSVRFCVPDIIYAWPPLDYEYLLSHAPIAQAAFAQRLFVLTTGGAELFTGSDPASMDQKPMETAICVSQRSVVTGDSFCMWAAVDGLWYFGVDGYRCLTDGFLKNTQWAALAPSTIAGYLVRLGERQLYVGFYNDGALKGFVVDPANPDGIYFLSTGYSAGYWDLLLGKLFVLNGSTLQQWDSGASNMTATWVGRVARQPAQIEAEWLEIMSSGSVDVTLLTEAAGATSDATALVTRMSRTVARGEHRVPDGTVGRDYQVAFSTTGSVQAIGVD